MNRGRPEELLARISSIGRLEAVEDNCGLSQNIEVHDLA
jgi:hypothetical protein